MNNIIPVQEAVIDVEVLRNHLPDGAYVVSVNADSFDEDVFEYVFGDEAEKDGWVEVLTTANNPMDPYVVQGEIHFYNPAYRQGQVFSTRESVCKMAEDVSFVCRIGDQDAIQSKKEYLCV